MCTITSPLHSGGRKRKGKKSEDGPQMTNDSRKFIGNFILCDSPASWKAMEPLNLSRFLSMGTCSLSLSDLQCSLCRHIVDRPVDTPCCKLLCADCISEHILSMEDTQEQSTQCPSCAESHQITTTSFTPPSKVVLKILGTMLLHCDKPSCSAVVALADLREHLESGCQKKPLTFLDLN